ncbi:MAG TPA: NAD(P)/FAD-dependent oxidoreductase [Mycobacterium sp.]|nr:NAD(P)/FAD-dependent oxidoreductase [Mycobacterium sp.]
MDDSAHPGTAHHLDVLIVGAGISGIGAAYYLQQEHPGRSYAILEARDACGGTWDLFRYPGFRSDSDLLTFAYAFKPWRHEDAIASGDKILDYLRETVTENGIDAHIRFHHKVLGAAWSTETARWTVDVEHGETGELLQFSANWLFCAGGYYRYDEGHTPVFEGRERFGGQVIHPQHWPEELDYTGKKVVIIGSGATAVTLVPSMAETAAHVTMLQRSPTYVLPVLRRDHFGTTAQKLLGARLGYALARRKNILKQRALFELLQRFPQTGRRIIRWVNAAKLPDGYPVDEHFQPAYNPWDQRLCAVPDGDLYTAISAGTASVVTDHIETFTETGIQLASGAHLDADIVVTATGLNVQMFGGVALSVDGKPVHLPDTVAYKSMMLTGIPNFVYVFGYTNSSWTLKVGPICEHFCRLLSYMDSHGYDVVTAELDDPAMPTKPLLDFGANYVRRVADQLPRQGVREPYTVSMSYLRDSRRLRHGDVTDSCLRFARAARVDAFQQLNSVVV